MFGTITACRHVLGARHGEWMAAMCGVCLAIRDRAGQTARAALSTDAVATAALAVDVARTGGAAPPEQRHAGPCPARGMRTADVWVGAPATLGAGVSLLAASVAVRDRVEDDQLAAIWRRPARHWADRVGSRAAAALEAAGIDLDRIDAALAASRDAEQRRATTLAAWTEPVADAYGAVFAPLGLDEVGRAIGRVTLLTDAIEDAEEDAAAGRPNPVLTGACTIEEARDVVAADVALVGARVAMAAPGSLAALLWGPGLERGVRTRLRDGCAGRCSASGHATSSTPDTEDPVWPTGTPDDATDDLDEGADQDATTEDERTKRRTGESTWCERCDCCSCDCCDCDACDGDCCDCCCPCDC